MRASLHRCKELASCTITGTWHGKLDLCRNEDAVEHKAHMYLYVLRSGCGERRAMALKAQCYCCYCCWIWLRGDMCMARTCWRCT
jgi:hypothetical protein